MTASKPGSGDNMMSQALKPYPSYNESGLPWTGQVPEGWDTIRIKHFLREIDSRTDTGEEILLSLRIKLGLVPHNDVSEKAVKPSDLIGYKRVRSGQLVMNRMQASNGLFAVAPMDGLVSPDYAVFKKIADVNLDYVSRLCKLPSMKIKFRAESKGLGTGTSGFLRLYSDRFGSIRIALPPLEQQDHIVRYVRHKEVQIAKFIQAKRKLIALLNEQKQAIINQAVTRGLDPNVRLKPSGVDYLGDIPEHWEVLKLKRIVGFNPSKQESAQYFQRNDSVVFLPMEKVSAEGVIDCSEVRPVAELWSGFTYFRKNDVVVAKITPCFENGKGACLDNLEAPIGFGTTEFIVMRPGNRILPKYLYYITRFSRFRILGEEAMTGAAGQQRVPTDFMKDFLCGLPEKPEQAQIVELIEDELSKVAHLIERAKTEIDLIREYRTRLISDVVTGKLDVRGIEVKDGDAIEVLDDLDEAEDDAPLDEAAESLNEDD